jgi:hypothetical protein
MFFYLLKVLPLSVFSPTRANILDVSKVWHLSLLVKYQQRRKLTNISTLQHSNISTTNYANFAAL